MVGNHDATEQNPVARVAMDAVGMWPALVGLKAAGFYAIWSINSDDMDELEVELAGLFFAGLLASVNNLAETHAGPGLGALW